MFLYAAASFLLAITSGVVSYYSDSAGVIEGTLIAMTVFLVLTVALIVYGLIEHDGASGHDRRRHRQQRT